VIQKLVDLALRQRFLILILGLVLLVWGCISFERLPIEAYPDIAPQWVQVITQWPGHAAQEVAEQISVPVETAMYGIRNMTAMRSHTIFGLSVVTMTFSDSSNDLWNREQVLERLANVTLPNGIKPALGPDYSPVGQIYWYTLQSTNPKYDLMQLKALQDWVINRHLKSVPGVVGDSSFGGLTREYQVRLNPNRLIEYNLTIGDVERALQANNENAGGGFIQQGLQMFDVRSVGLVRDTRDIGGIFLKQVNGTPVYVRDVGRVVEGHVVRLGQIGKTVREANGTIVDNNDVVEGVVLLQKGAETEQTLEGVMAEVHTLNHGMLPRGVRIVPYLNRIDLIHYTTRTVLQNLAIGFVLVTLVLFVFLGNARTAFIVAATIPFSLLFAFTCLDARHIPANLLSLGALDFGIIVDGAVMMVENIFRKMAEDHGGRTKAELIGFAAHEIQRPVFFAIILIVVAYLPIFTLPGVSGKLFSPMAWTTSFALLGSLIFALIIAPVLCSYLFGPGLRERPNPLMKFLERWYARGLRWCLGHRRAVLWNSAGLLVAMLAIGGSGVLGSEFLPNLNEGAIWARGVLPRSTGPTLGAEVAKKVRLILATFPEVTTVVSQDGRPDDGTAPSGFFSTQYGIVLKPQSQWPEPYRSASRKTLTDAINRRLKRAVPYAVWNFSQPIEDNLYSAVSGVSGDNAVKVYGPDLATLEKEAPKVQAALRSVPGIVNTGIFPVTGQPNVNIRVSRSQASRFGISVSQIRRAVEGAVGGRVVSQVFSSQMRFPLAVRYQRRFRTSVAAIAAIRILSSTGARVSLGQLCHIAVQAGESTIYREHDEPFIPIKFSVRGRSLGAAVAQAEQVVQTRVKLPNGYFVRWAGEYKNEVQANRKLEEIIPITVLGIALLLYLAFNSFKWVLVILLDVALAPLGGLLALWATHTYFSVSSGVGMLALFGVSIQIGMIMVEYMNQLRARGASIEDAAAEAARVRLRPILMAMLVDILGLLPAALSHAIGSDAQRPFAIAIVGGLVLALAISLFLLPTLYVTIARSGDSLPHESPASAHAQGEHA
jgi:cobalt-zinc-cadmium resistance protein CzcA